MRVRWLLPLAVALPAIQVAYAVQYLSAEQAQREAFPSAATFVEVPLGSDAAARSQLLEALAAPVAWSPHIVEARDAQGMLGWVLVDRVIGKTEAITYSLALDRTGTVIALQILEYRESHGSEIRLPAWRKQFVGKGPADAAVLSKQVRIISGATLSCRHVTDGVARLLKLYGRAFGAGIATG